MGTKGFLRAADIDYRPDEMILEVGSGESTRFLAEIGPVVHTIDPSPDWVPMHPNVRVHMGYAENVLKLQDWPIGFAWLDGHDWPYTGNSEEYYADQRARYEQRGQEYSQEASRRSHLKIAELIGAHARVVAFDDTWRTHEWYTMSHHQTGIIDFHGPCAAPVPPATPPAPMLAMDQPLGGDVCGLPPDHPHHDDPDRGWNGKGGTAIPYLIDHGFRVLEYRLGLVILERS
jgi:hypothetical protein